MKSNSPRFQFLTFLQSNNISFSNLKQIHAQLIINGNNHSSNLAKLIQSCCNLSTQPALNHAKSIQTHSTSTTTNVYLLNVLIRCSPPRNSISSFADSLSSKPNLVFDNRTYVFVLGSCARLSIVSALFEGKQVHARGIKDGLFSDIMVQTTAIHFYGIHREIHSARKLFDEMSMRNSVTWSAMIRGYCIQKEKIPRYARDAIKLFREMLINREVGSPNESTMVCILSAVSQLGSLENGICIHGYIQKTVYKPEIDVFIGTGLIDMYSKCGLINTAIRIFNIMEIKNVLTWTAMMTGLAIHGRGKETIELMNAMESNNLKPNEVTFTSLLAACCHWGLVQEGLCLFESMEGRFGIKPTIQHYGCIVNLLGRAGLLNEAYEFIIGMNRKPDAVVWRSLLNACKLHGEVLMAEKVGRILLEFDSEKIDASEDYIALSNAYALVDRWDDVEMVREVMKVKGVQIDPGFSRVHLFDNS
ncbi:pentatricopeptide repeat-containing protein At3g18970 [Impatiens glandulifera]|uniref:pentatricopeptide repeat-containing protein At3g18970 n=1 Tax=Impatiens glandulifera TaxID=253017 RepID=UPI001FB06094|nr:pentatricopeptide repeat-containing protein At3g18970 [Impatiens glandulifera]